MSIEEVEDEELASLKRRRGELVNETIKLKGQLKSWETTEIETGRKIEKDFLPPAKEFEELLTIDEPRVNDQRQKKISAFSNFVTGMKFTSIDKKRISEQNYVYVANVKSKALEFSLEVIVDAQKGSKDRPEVLDINCDFSNIRDCYTVEITPWIERFIDAKDTSALFSAVSDYTDKNVTRLKILMKLSDLNVVTSKEITEEDGGILVLLHAKDDPDFVYFEIRWVLKWVVSLWRIDNCFVIEPISAGDEFLKTNDKLLQDFCKCRIKKNHLEDMWKELASAVRSDETAQSMIESNST